MKIYYLHNGTDQSGPFDIEDLKNKNISRGTLVWYEGIPDWTTAEKINDLEILFDKIPPPFIKGNSTLPPIPKPDPKESGTERKRNNLSLYVLLVTGVLILILGLTYLLKDKPTNNENKLNTGANMNSSKDTIVIKTPVDVQTKNETKPILNETKPIVNDNKSSFKDKLIGNHNYGVQFIWDGYGTANISNNGENLLINGSQYSKDNTEYCKINGEIEVVNERTLNFTGNITMFTNNCCGVFNKNGSFTFVKTGDRKFWRLQQRNQICDINICSYYLDIFE